MYRSQVSIGRLVKHVECINCIINTTQSHDRPHGNAPMRKREGKSPGDEMRKTSSPESTCNAETEGEKMGKPLRSDNSGEDERITDHGRCFLLDPYLRLHLQLGNDAASSSLSLLALDGTSLLSNETRRCCKDDASHLWQEGLAREMSVLQGYQLNRTTETRADYIQRSEAAAS
ncbi:hypothetical protein ACLOJK_001259 [Asimina triloba]